MMVIIVDGTIASIITGLVLGIALGSVLVFRFGYAQSRKGQVNGNNE